MIEVALESSGRPGSVAARLNDRIVELDLSADTAHASDLLSALDGLVRSLGGTPRDVSAVFVGIGPGSFTGLRVAIATAQGIARGTDAKLRGVSSFEAFALGALADEEEAFIVSNAYSFELYFAHYRRENNRISVLSEPTIVPAAPLQLPLQARIFGDEKALKAAALDSRAEARPYIPPRARFVLELGAQRLEELGAEQPETVEPLYLRPFAAKKRRR